MAKDRAESASQAALRRESFRANVSFLLRRAGMMPRQLQQKLGVDRHVIAKWLKTGVSRPRLDHLAKLAEIFDLHDPMLLLDADLPHRVSHGLVSASARDRIDRQTNPAIEDVVRVHPELFEQFDGDDWRELYSHHGTGGPLTDEAVFQVAQQIVSKRAVRQKFEALLETNHFELVRQFVDALYRDIEASRSGDRNGAKRTDPSADEVG